MKEKERLMRTKESQIDKRERKADRHMIEKERPTGDNKGERMTDR